MIKLEGIAKIYQINEESVFTALSHISLSIKSGEFIGIVGPSGSGKSTLMHLIGLLDTPTSGRMLIEGKDISNLSDDQLSRLRSHFVGFVFQQFNLINKLTILENVMLPTLYTTIPLAFDPETRAIELLRRFGIADKAASYPNKISGGQQQRTAMARALMMNPRLILADEPTGNLDTKTGAEILKILVDLHRIDGRTIVIVTHDPTIAKLTKRTIHVRDGTTI